MAALSDLELAAWLRLVHTVGLGRATMRRLLARFGSPEAVLATSEAQRRALLPPKACEALAADPAAHTARFHQTQAWLAAAPARRVLVLGEADYPADLLQTADPPLLLYLEGRAELLAGPMVAIVGSRRPTAQGREHALQFGRGLCSQGWTVVSGLAAGIDGAAHEGALQAHQAGSAASTVAVVGTGLDRVYPRAHRALAERIAAAGLLLSEYPLGAEPLAAHFPQRNRIIAGLTRGTLVVEAAWPSGSLITARMAADAGREVMALPGSIQSTQSAGCHALIRDGAALVTCVDEALAELGGLPGYQRPLPLSGEVPGMGAAASGMAIAPSAFAQRQPSSADGDSGLVPDAGASPVEAEDPVLRALGHDPVSLDTLIARCGWPAPRLAAHLLTLELEGRVARLPGGLYQRCGTA